MIGDEFNDADQKSPLNMSIGNMIRSMSIVNQKSKFDHRAVIVEDLPEEIRENNEIFNRNKEKFIIRLTNEWRLRWDLTVMIMATWNCIAIPIEIGMEPDFANNILWIILNHFIDLVFVVDIILTFRTSFISGGDEITSPKKIAINYLKSRFVIDLLSVIPWDYFPSSLARQLQIFGMLKIQRVFRIG